jgi:hypothetical protein
VFPVRYELDLYIKFVRISVFKGLSNSVCSEVLSSGLNSSTLAIKCTLQQQVFITRQ